MTDRIRWGFLATGWMAEKFAEGMSVVPDAEIAAVGSRALDTADAFGDRFEVPRRYGSYAELVADPDIDIVYVSSPNPFHREHTLLALEAGKPVLCEKPFALNAGEAEEMIAAARSRQLFLMEAMWARFIPGMIKVREWLASGAIGEVRMLDAEFGFRARFDPTQRLFNPRLGGGSLLDIGIYTLAFASMVLGPHPGRVEALAEMGKTGVDDQAAVLLGYAGGQIAVLRSAVRTTFQGRARIHGTEGMITLDPPFHRTEGVTLESGGCKEHYEFPLRRNGYEFEAEAVNEYLRAGKLESEAIPLDETLALVRIMDRIRDIWGLKYPAERSS